MFADKYKNGGAQRGLRPGALVCVLLVGIALAGVLASASASGGRAGGIGAWFDSLGPDVAAQAPAAGKGDARENDAQVDEDDAAAVHARIDEALAALPDVVSLDETADVQPEQAEHRSDEVIARLFEGTSAADLNELLARLDFAVAEDVSDQDLLSGIATIALVPGTDVARAARTLEETGVVEGAQPNYVYRLMDADLAAADAEALQVQSTSVNDPDVSKQWTLEKTRVYEAWDVAKANGKVTVAVIDDGCVVDHEDLKDNIVDKYNAVNGGTDVSHVSSKQHGTHVAGIVAARANNGLGVAGASYNAGILPIQIFVKSGDSGETADTETVVSAYDYILEHANALNIRVVNMSIGAYMTKGDAAVERAVKRAYNSGIVTVCAAGNQDSGDENTTPPYQCFPVDFCDEAVGVINLRQASAANDGSGVERASNSNYNKPGQKTKDISAPGTSIYSTYGPKTNDYSNSSGTSMAAPLVAGIVALEFVADPTLSAQQAIDALHNGAVDLGVEGWDEETGYGMASAYGALQQLPVNLEGETLARVGGSIELAPSRYEPSIFTWTSSNEVVATVSADGVVSCKGMGQATITASWGEVSASKDITVWDIQLACPTSLRKGEYVSRCISSNLAGWRLESSETGVATIFPGFYSNSDVVRAVGVGTTVLTANNALYGLSEQVTVNVYDPHIVNSSGTTTIGVLVGKSDELAIEGAPEGVEWTWESSNAGVCSVVASSSDSTVAEITGCSVGEAEVVVLPATDIPGRATSDVFAMSASVNVTSSELSESATSIDLSQGPFTYSPWGGVGPSVTVTHYGKELVKDVDYKVEYVDNEKAGEATVRVVGIGEYVNSVSKTFEVEPASIEIASVASIPNLAYSGDPCEPNLEVAVSLLIASTPFGDIGNRKVLESGVDYELSYENNVNVGTATVTITGIGNYTGSRSATFTIDPAPIGDAVDINGIPGYTYTGKACEPEPSITVKAIESSVEPTAPAVEADEPSASPNAESAETAVADAEQAEPQLLQRGVDYELSYSNNVNAGTATVTATGLGNYTGTVSATFTIAPASIAKASVSAIANQPFTGKAVRPVPDAKLDGRTLVAGKDYTTAYGNNTKAGTATVTLTGKGNYSADTSKTATFKIVAPSVSYRTKLQGSSWKSYVRDGATMGIAKTTKKRLKAIGAKLAVKPVSGSLSYRVRTQNKWLAWKSNGSPASVGSSKKRMEALQMKLTGQMAKNYDVYYRAYVQKLGWTGWAKNGKSAGTKGYGLRIQAMQVKVVPKGAAAPGSTKKTFRRR